MRAAGVERGEFPGGVPGTLLLPNFSPRATSMIYLWKQLKMLKTG